MRFSFKKKEKCAARATFDVITVMFYSNLIALKKTVSFSRLDSSLLEGKATGAPS